MFCHWWWAFIIAALLLRGISEFRCEQKVGGNPVQFSQLREGRDPNPSRYGAQQISADAILSSSDVTERLFVRPQKFGSITDGAVSMAVLTFAVSCLPALRSHPLKALDHVAGKLFHRHRPSGKDAATSFLEG